MPQTLFDKIWDAHLVAQRADGRDLIYIDRHVLHELHAPHAFEELAEAAAAGAPARPDFLGAGSHRRHQARPRRQHQSVRRGVPARRCARAAARTASSVFDLGDPEQGISHVVAPELGMVLPGATHAVPDSHASTVGGLGALAFGCGTTELAHILATQVMAMKRPKRMRVRLDGRLGAACHRQGRGAAHHRRDSASPARAAMSSNMPARRSRAMPIEQRMTLCNLNIEMGGRSGFVAPDDATFAVARGPALRAAGRDVGSRAGALAHADDRRRRGVRPRGRARLRRRSSRRSPGAPTRARCSAFPAACPIRPARRRRAGAPRCESALAYMGLAARHGARRPAGQPRVHRLLHQRAAAGPASRRRRGARPARRRRRRRDGGAGLDRR